MVCDPAIPVVHTNLPGVSIEVNSCDIDVRDLRIFGKKIRKARLLAAALILLNIAVWKDALPGRAAAKMIFFDAGHGDAALLMLRGGENILIDAGSGGSEGALAIGKNVIAPYLWNNGIGKIDLAIVSHPHEDHLGGMLYVLENFKVGAVIDNGLMYPETDRLSRRYIRILEARGIRRIRAARGDVMNLGDAEIRILNPGLGSGRRDPNDDSIVARISSSGLSFLMCADATSVAMEEMMSEKDALASDVVKVPHHGGKIGDIGIVKEFFDAARPKLFVISCRDKEASTAVTGIISSDIYITGKNGAVEIREDSDGELKIRSVVKK